MPVQINEMILRANITDPDDGPHTGKDTDDNASESGAINKEEIIRECTEKILEILKNKNER
jgi:Family of unknown function (DUF5908)